ncbi:46235_t:CDS:2 [Gigaspora margarita]|uniref:46235_t:CDS:1 n=1 Tax=Gigaspora margarita TaxID=4874 RepID=A0ABN7UJF2_GIGMA|nr:46235_t:CDS:2 [Gigaspora margarita]
MVESGLYTTITYKEIDIPLRCPENYNYTLPLVKIACQIRSANLIFMWITGVILASPIFCLC